MLDTNSVLFGFPSYYIGVYSSPLTLEWTLCQMREPTSDDLNLQLNIFVCQRGHEYLDLLPTAEYKLSLLWGNKKTI